MKRLSLILLPLAALAATPEVSNVALSPSDDPGKVTVTYDLANPPAVVTASFSLDGGGYVPETASWYMDGDVNTVVEGTHGTFTWDYRHTLTNVSGNLSVTLTAWTLDAPPLYCAIDLTDGPTATDYPLEFYVSAEAVPGGVTNNAYKTRKVLLRRIPATGEAGFVMGSPEGEAGRDKTREAQHTVVLTHDFYIGVHAVTQEQYRRVRGTYGFCYLGNDQAGWPYCPERPAEKVRYGGLRGSRAQGIDWPTTTNAVDAASFLGVLRARTGNRLLWDLPMDAQWEYACRAGTTTAYNDGTSAADGVAWCGRSGNDNSTVTPAQGGTQRVGLKQPNAWGLYDMHGNVFEWCCDWRQSDTSGFPRVNPVGPVKCDDAKNYYRIGRGGASYTGADKCRSAHRNSWGDEGVYNGWGFRLAATLGAVWDVSTTPPTLK